jgi:hypothetical protein
MKKEHVVTGKPSSTDSSVDRVRTNIPALIISSSEVAIWEITKMLLKPGRARPGPLNPASRSADVKSILLACSAGASPNTRPVHAQMQREWDCQ